MPDSLSPAELNPLSQRAKIKVLVVPVAIAIVLHIGCFFGVQQYIHPNDSPGYLAPARALLEGRGFVGSQGVAETIRTPGYPLFLAALFALGASVPTVVFVQHLLSIMLVATTAAIGFRLSGSVAVGIIAGIVLACDVPTIQNANWIMTEMLSTAFVLAVAVFTYRSSKATSVRSGLMSAAASGLLAGCTVLVRPVALLLGGVIALVLLIGHGPARVRAAALAVTLSWVAPGAWMLRNHHETGHAVVSSIAAINMLEYRAAGVLAIEDPGDFQTNWLSRRGELVAKACAEIAATLPGRACDSISTTDRSDVYSRIGFSVVRSHPFGYAKLMVHGLAMIMFGDGASFLTSVLSLSQRQARILCVLITAPLALLALLGLGYWWQHDRTALWIMVLFVSYFFIISAGAEADARFRVPVMPFYAILAAGGVAMTLAYRGSVSGRPEG